MSFRVPMRELEVQVALSGAPPETCTIYLAPYSDRREGGETMEEYLNGPRRFLPTSCNASPHIVNREQIVWIRVSAAEPGVTEEAVETVTRRTAAVELADGTVLEGEVRIDKPFEQSRLSDVLNDSRVAFLRLETGEWVHYIQKRFIRYATE